MALSNERIKELDAIAQRDGLARAGEPKNERKGVLRTIATDLATPFVRTGVNAYNLVSGLGNLGAAGIAKVAGNDEAARRFVIKAGEEADKTRNVPFMGQVKPVGTSGDFGKDVKDVLGTGAQIAATIAPAGASRSAATVGLRTAVKEGAKAGLRYGAATGAAYEGGKALQDDAGALEVLQRTLVGGAAGGAIGGVFGAAMPVAGAATRKTVEAVKSGAQKGQEMVDAVVNTVKGNGLRTQIPGAEQRPPSMVEGIIENARGTVNKMKGAAERSRINVEAQREARVAFEQLAPDSQEAIRNGLLPRDVQLIKTGNATEKEVYKKIIKSAENYAENRGSNNRPSAILGEEFTKRLTKLNQVVTDENKALDSIVQQFKSVPLDSNATVNAVLKRLGDVSGLGGINVDAAGKLVFTNTTLSGKNSAAARAELQRIFDDVVTRSSDPNKLHLFRKELFEDLGGKKAGGIKLTGTEEKAVNAMRQGMADAIETVAPNSYKEANTRVAKLIDLQKQIRQRFGEISDGKEDIFNVNSGVLLRRLTSNSTTGQEIAGLIADAETALADYGVDFGTNLTRLQEFLNVLDRYYDIAPDTSLLGIRRNTVPTSKTEILQRIADIVGGNFKASDETAKVAIRKLLGL